MNFITFSVGSTNIFPMANSVTGGQYATESNLRTRESVCTPEVVQYSIGPSYAHSERDYLVHNSGSMLLIDPGTALVNGHYVQNISQMQIDMAAARAADSTLVGELCIGLRAMYSTDTTMAGTILTTADQMYEGVQVVILPKSEFKLPADVPTDENAVTAHLKLADFTYRNGSISGLVNNYPGKCQVMDASRVASNEDQLYGKYLSKSGLNGRNLYVFAGKGTATDENGNPYDTWCIAQDSLMIWDANSQLGTERHTNREEAEFIGDPSTGLVSLYMPHKQVDYDISDTHGHPLYFQPKVISLPGANYTTGTPGTVTPDFIQHIKDKFDELGRYQSTPNGKQMLYLEELHDRSELPSIVPPTYMLQPGCYVLVGRDYTVLDESDSISPPSTMYVIQQGAATSLKYLYSFYGDNINDSIPQTQEIASGFKIAQQAFDPDEVVHDSEDGAANDMWNIGNGGIYHGNVSRHDYLIGTTSRETGYEVPEGAQFESSTMVEDGALTVDAVEFNVYLITASGVWSWTDPIWITGQVPLATESAVGGFLNVPETAVDGGYIYRDESGHLRLLDYDLLRTGTLAYRLSDDVSITGLTMEALQAELDDRVNERVAFPSANQMGLNIQANRISNMVNVTIELADDDTASVVHLHGLDSRFGTSVYLHITGSATSATTLLISDCEKIRIDNNIGGSPIIQLHNCGLCYDAAVLDRISVITGLKLWYQQLALDHADEISVDGLTVTDLSPQVIPQMIDFWSDNDLNDNHYDYALRSITFSNLGEIVGASIMIRNNSTYNIDPGVSMYVSDFVLPQGAHLTFPRSRLNSQLHIDGTFVAAYPSESEYIVAVTSFTIVSDTYSASYDLTNPTITRSTLGTISLFANALVTSSIAGVVNGLPFVPGTDIDGWAPNSFHVFSGGVVS